jgi:hypothetical protein
VLRHRAPDASALWAEGERGSPGSPGRATDGALPASPIAVHAGSVGSVSDDGWRRGSAGDVPSSPTFRDSSPVTPTEAYRSNQWSASAWSGGVGSPEELPKRPSTYVCSRPCRRACSRLVTCVRHSRCCVSFGARSSGAVMHRGGGAGSVSASHRVGLSSDGPVSVSVSAVGGIASVPRGVGVAAASVAAPGADLAHGAQAARVGSGDGADGAASSLRSPGTVRPGDASDAAPPRSSNQPETPGSEARRRVKDRTRSMDRAASSRADDGVASVGAVAAPTPPRSRPPLPATKSAHAATASSPFASPAAADGSQHRRRRSADSVVGEGVSKRDDELVELLRQRPKYVPMLRSRDSFRAFFRGVERARMEALLREAFVALEPADRDEKVLKRMQLLEDVCV